MSLDARAKALSALARVQVAEVPIGTTLLRIADITLEAMPAASFAGMTMLGPDERPTTAVFTDERSPEIDEAQYREGKGPCLDAWRRNQILRVDDVVDLADECPGFTAGCLDHGVHSTLSLPMAVGERAIGALNLYATTTRAFGEDEEAVGAELAGAAGAVLSNAAAYWSAYELGQQLREAMQTRAVIEQAKGMVMARSPGMTADEAFEILRRASQRENVKLALIAQRIVEHRGPAIDTTAPDGPDGA